METPKPLNLNGKNLKNDFERFLFYSDFAFTYLESLVYDWTPKNKKYNKLDELVREFSTYYTENTKREFPDSWLEDLRSIVVRNKDVLL